MKNEVEGRCGLEVSVFQKKATKMESRGHPNEFLLVPFGSLLAYFFDLCVPWGSRNRLRTYWHDLVWFWVPPELPFGNLFLKNRDLEAASTFDLIFHAFRAPQASLLKSFLTLFR